MPHSEVIELIRRLNRMKLGPREGSIPSSMPDLGLAQVLIMNNFLISEQQDGIQRERIYLPFLFPD